MKSMQVAKNGDVNEIYIYQKSDTSGNRENPAEMRKNAEKGAFGRKNTWKILENGGMTAKRGNLAYNLVDIFSKNPL